MNKNQIIQHLVFMVVMVLLFVASSIPNNSFAAGTPDGKVNIESLIKGNTVLSRARLSYDDKPQTIEKTFGRTAPHYYQLTTEFGTLKVTEEHPIWKQGLGWTEAQYLKVDDVVASADGDVLILDNLRVEKPLQVYNFSVENTPSYFAGTGKLWVHNAKCKTVFASPIQLQKKFKHAKDFGVEGNYNLEKANKFNEAIQKHINSPSVKEFDGIYHGDPVVFHVDPNTGLMVMQKPDGAFISGWKLSDKQLEHVLNDKKL